MLFYHLRGCTRSFHLIPVGMNNESCNYYFVQQALLEIKKKIEKSGVKAYYLFHPL